MEGDGSRLEVVLDAADIGVWWLDTATGRADWSARMAELHRAEPRRRGAEDDVFVAVVDEDRIQVRDALTRARRAADVTEVEYRVGSGVDSRWVNLRIAPIEGPAGPRVLAGLATDATGRKQTEIDGARRRATVEALRWVLEAMIAGTALDDTAAGVIESACGVLGAEVGVVVHPRPGDVVEELTWQTHGFGDDGPAPPHDLSLPPPSLASTRVSVIGDRDSTPELSRLLEAHGLPPDRFRSALVVPVHGAGGTVIGHLLFGSSRVRYFTSDDAELAVSIASSTGVAIDNARRHERERLAAQTFQRALLPDVPGGHDGVVTCVRYHPGRSGIDVGGDWYDVLELPDGRLGLAVGDVCGHGFTAAAHMSQLRHSFRALVQAGVDPVEAFRVLNRMALEELRTTVTIGYVDVDAGSGECRAWSCGHLPPMVAGPGRDAAWIDELGEHGPMLGFLDEIDVPSSTFHLDVGDTVLLYTDGLVERRGEDLDEGLRRLATALGTAEGVLDDLCDALYRDLAVVGPEADDTAMLAVRRTHRSDDDRRVEV